MYIYELVTPIDNFSGIVRLTDYILLEKIKIAEGEPLTEELDELQNFVAECFMACGLSNSSWEKDIRGNEIYIGSIPPPFENVRFVNYLVWKQENGGSTYIVSLTNFELFDRYYTGEYRRHFCKLTQEMRDEYLKDYFSLTHKYFNQEEVSRMSLELKAKVNHNEDEWTSVKTIKRGHALLSDQVYASITISTSKLKKTSYLVTITLGEDVAKLLHINPGTRVNILFNSKDKYIFKIVQDNTLGSKSVTKSKESNNYRITMTLWEGHPLKEQRQSIPVPFELFSDLSFTIDLNSFKADKK